jgi:hypothetical protein
MTNDPSEVSDERAELTDAVDGGLAAADDTVVYDLSEWEADQIDTLEWALGREGVASVLRDRELTIRVDDEARVDLLIDHLFDDVGDVELEAVDDEGESDLNAMEALGDLFVAVDRLLHAVDDQILQATFEEATTALEGLPLPFGFEPEVWDRIRMMAGWLVDELDGAEAALIEEHAEALRVLLRQYV